MPLDSTIILKTNSHNFNDKQEVAAGDRKFVRWSQVPRSMFRVLVAERIQIGWRADDCRMCKPSAERMGSAHSAGVAAMEKPDLALRPP